MNKSTEFVFRLLVTIIEPLITLLSHILDSREKQDSKDKSEDEE